MTEEQLALLSARLTNFLYGICAARGVQIEISEPRVAEVIVHFHKDNEKLEYHQGEQISANKRIAGLVFWIRRIKPILFASKVNSDVEICDINEQVGLWAAHSLMAHYAGSEHAPEPLKSAAINDKAAEFRAYLYHYWRISGFYNYTSLVYSLRYRNFSPHHLAIVFDAITSGFVLKHTVFQPATY